MPHFLTLVTGMALLAGVASQVAAAPRLDAEARLAQALEGRVAGEPVNCLNLSRVRSTEIIDGTAILYKAGNTIYVNRPRAGARSLDDRDVLVTELYGSQLCSINVVTLYDSSSRFQTGSVFLGEFVPYKRTRAGD